MTKINYTMADGKEVTIEVSEEFAANYKAAEITFNRNEEKFMWRARMKETSYEKLNEETGYEIKDKSIPIEEQAEQNEFIEDFMSLLTEQQKIVFKKVYIEDLPLRTVAMQLKMRLYAVQKHILLIQKKFLKNFYKNGGQKHTSHSFIVKGDDVCD